MAESQDIFTIPMATTALCNLSTRRQKRVGKDEEGRGTLHTNAKGLMAYLFRGKVHLAKNQMKTAELN